MSNGYLENVRKCDGCEERWCDAHGMHWADCDCPAPDAGDLIVYTTSPANKPVPQDGAAFQDAWVWSDEEGARENAEEGGHRLLRLRVTVIGIEEMEVQR